MARHEVKCINKLRNEGSYGIIQNIGGLNSDGSRWRITQKRAIQGIESDKWQFYIKFMDKEVDIIVSSYDGRKFLKTVSDDFVENNLNNLPECPY